MFPVIGARPVKAIEPAHLMTALAPLDARGRRETAHRTKQVCGQVLRYAIITGRATRDGTRDLKGALAPINPTHFAAITDPAQVGEFLRAIEGFSHSIIVGAALRLSPYLFARPGELRRMEWAELQLDGRVWQIPAAKMKLRQAHTVPLSTQAIAILTEIRPLTGKGRYVFPHARSVTRPMSDGTINAALRRLGYGPTEATAHGFRAMARTLLHEQLHIDPDVIEVQLAHTVRGTLGDTYNRARFLDRRIAMMQSWGDYLDTLRAIRP